LKGKDRKARFIHEIPCLWMCEEGEGDCVQYLCLKKEGTVCKGFCEDFTDEDAAIKSIKKRGFVSREPEKDSDETKGVRFFYSSGRRKSETVKLVYPVVYF
jgi:hypothetical protein